MASWVLVPCLICLREELDLVAPNRDKKSDGSIGNQEHAERDSDHNPDETGNTHDEDSDNINEVHAIDVDKDLRAHFTMTDVVNYLVGECRKSNDVGKDKGRLQLIIWNGYEYSASTGWAKVKYTGDNKHTEHAHFSAEYDNKYSQDTSSWGIIERFATTMPEVTSFSPHAVDQLVAAATKGVLSYGDKADGVEEGGVTDIPGQDATNVLGQIDQTYKDTTQLKAEVAELKEISAAMREDLTNIINILTETVPETH